MVLPVQQIKKYETFIIFQKSFILNVNHLTFTLDEIHIT